jgi:radical SAM protein (TIGR01212 family)
VNTISPFHRYSDYLKERFGVRLQKISVDAGFTCPNRDGKISHGGCTYCNNDSFRPPVPVTMSIKDQIERGIRVLAKRYSTKNFIVYFQTYSNTYAPVEQLEKMYKEALSIPGIVGLAIATRPDCLNEETLSLLSSLARTHEISVEIGVESLCAETLLRINRGHDVACAKKAIEDCHENGIKTCAHLIIGFPWENHDFWMNEAEEISTWPVDFLKLHQLHVVRDTPLALSYASGEFKTLEINEYIEIVAAFLAHLSPRIAIQGLFAGGPADLLLSPKWRLTVSELTRELITFMHEHGISQGSLLSGSKF